MTEIKREVIDLREYMGAYGRHFSGKFDRENLSIKRMKTNEKKCTPRGKNYERVCERGKNRKNLQT
jgi:hypothetical protein